LGAGLVNSGCAAGSDNPAESIAACAVWVLSNEAGIAPVNPAAIAALTLSVRKSRRFIFFLPIFSHLVLLHLCIGVNPNITCVPF
jgi:hypothetical protein